MQNTATLQPLRPRALLGASLWGRIRVQLGGALVLGVALPIVVVSAWNRLSSEFLVQTVVGVLVAVLLGFYLFRNLTVFPGIRTSYYISPSLLVAYGFVLVCLFFLRLDYSRAAFLVSFCASLVWLLAADFLSQNGSRLKIGVVPFGSLETLPEVPGIEWHRLPAPEYDRPYDALVADFRADLPDEWEAFLAHSAVSGAIVFHIKQLRESLTGKVEIEHLMENSFGSLVPFMAYLKIRRLIDILLALVLGALLLPILLIITLLIRLETPGPALFRQQRIGYKGRPFMVTKFRTMCHRPMMTISRESAMTKNEDPRITRVGRILRRTRLDELPQIWNILKGEMSWIGPRPEADILSKWYEDELPFYHYRHIVPPGITGWAQVSQGHVALLKQVNGKLHYDFYYIKHFSPWLDILIIIMTIKTIITGFGSK